VDESRFIKQAPSDLGLFVERVGFTETAILFESKLFARGFFIFGGIVIFSFTFSALKSN
jgi:hypothetical protein